jgi:hypothetical protein
MYQLDLISVLSRYGKLSDMKLQTQGLQTIGNSKGPTTQKPQATVIPVLFGRLSSLWTLSLIPHDTKPSAQIDLC